MRANKVSLLAEATRHTAVSSKVQMSDDWYIDNMGYKFLLFEFPFNCENGILFPILTIGNQFPLREVV